MMVSIDWRYEEEIAKGKKGLRREAGKV